MADKEIAILENDEPGTIVYITIDRSYAGSIVISDEIKKDSKNLLVLLKALGIKKTVMLTGDNKIIGDKVGKQLD